MGFLSPSVFQCRTAGLWAILLLSTSWRQTDVQAQEPFFRAQSPREMAGLAATAVFQDSKGWIWLGTEDGLFRFDGRNALRVPCADNLNPGPVRSIGEWNNRIWVGHTTGAICLLPMDITFPEDPQGQPLPAGPGGAMTLWQPEEGLPAKPIAAFAGDSRGNLWIATYGEGLYTFTGNRLYQWNAEDDGLGSNDLYALAPDREGNVWVGTDAGLVKCAMPSPGEKRLVRFGRAEGIPDEIVTALKFAPDGSLWLGTNDMGVCRFNPKSAAFERPNAEWSFGKVTGLAILGGSDVWIAAKTAGLVRWDLALQAFFPVPGPQGKGVNRVRTLMPDREGQLWVLSENGQVFATHARFGVLHTPDDTIQAVLPAMEGIWLGSRSGLFLFHQDTFTQMLQGENILSLWQSPRGEVWAGTFGNGVFILDRYSKKVRRLTEKDGLANGSILSICGAGNQVWLATLGGATALDLLSGKPIANYDYQSALGSNYIYKVFADKKGRLWFGTDGQGLTVLENGVFRRFTHAGEVLLGTVYSITEDHQGLIWFSTDKQGIFSCDGRTCRPFPADSRPATGPAWALTTDGFGQIVLGYSDGLGLMDPKTGRVTLWSAATGVPVSEVGLNALAADSRGNIWGGTGQGALRMAAFFRPVQSDPIPLLTSLSVNLQPVDFSRFGVFEHHRNYFLFHFTGHWYTAPETVRFRYFLEGFDHDWTVTHDNLASYPSLPPGRYRFRMQASRTGVFDGLPEVTYHFSIRKPLWSSWWFLLASAFASGALLYLLISVREKRLRKEALLKREKLESQFAALKSQINPHFLFNSFNTLIALIEENPRLAASYVDHLSDYYRSILEFRETNLIPLRQELELVRNFDFLLRKRYENGFLLNLLVDARQQGAIMPLTLQMLVENAVKHNVISASNPLVVDIFVENLYVVVRNNIRYKLKAEPGTHFGLSSLRHRYELLGERPVIVEEKDGHFTVKVPLIFNHSGKSSLS